MPPGSSAPIHRTKNVDYGLVLEGEIYLALDDGSETRLTSGDVVVQRGTAHAWYNRSETVTRMLFVLVDGEFTDELRSTLGEEALASSSDDAPSGATNRRDAAGGGSAGDVESWRVARRGAVTPDGDSG